MYDVNNLNFNVITWISLSFNMFISCYYLEFIVINRILLSQPRFHYCYLDFIVITWISLSLIYFLDNIVITCTSLSLPGFHFIMWITLL